MQLVVVMAVRKAVSAATITFTAISMNLFFIRRPTNYQLSIINYQLTLVFVEAIVISCARVDHQRAGLSGHREVTGVDTI